VTLSILAFVIIIQLDKIADADNSDSGTMLKLVTSLVAGISMLVGFTWEHSFDGAVESVAELNPSHPRTTKFFLGLGVMIVVLVPWRKFILKKAMELEELQVENEKNKVRAKARKQNPPMGSERADSSKPLLHSPPR